MKKLYVMLATAGLFGLISCGGTEQTEEAGTEAPVEQTETATQAAEQPAQQSEQLVEHVCSDKCSGDNHHLKHGEKGHACSDECKPAESKSEEPAPTNPEN